MKQASLFIRIYVLIILFFSLTGFGPKKSSKEINDLLVDEQKE